MNYIESGNVDGLKWAQMFNQTAANEPQGGIESRTTMAAVAR